MGSSAVCNFQSIGKDRRYLTGWLGVHKAKYSRPGQEMLKKSGVRMNGNRTITAEYAGCIAQPLTCDDLSVTCILYDARHRVRNNYSNGDYDNNRYQNYLIDWCSASITSPPLETTEIYAPNYGTDSLLGLC